MTNSTRLPRDPTDDFMFRFLVQFFHYLGVGWRLAETLAAPFGGIGVVIAYTLLTAFLLLSCWICRRFGFAEYLKVWLCLILAFIATLYSEPRDLINATSS